MSDSGIPEGFTPYVSQYVHLTRRDGREIGSLCCVKHCSKRADYGHNTMFGGLVVVLDLCDEHHREVS